MFLVQLTEFLEAARVHVQLVGASEVAAQAIPHRDGLATLGGNHFIESLTGAAVDFGDGDVQPVGQSHHLGGEPAGVGDLVDDEPRHLVLATQKAQFGALECEGGLPSDELG